MKHENLLLSNELITKEKLAFIKRLKIYLQWSIYLINSVVKTKFYVHVHELHHSKQNIVK